jgi:hypothetical protein
MTPAWVRGSADDEESRTDFNLAVIPIPQSRERNLALAYSAVRPTQNKIPRSAAKDSIGRLSYRLQRRGRLVHSSSPFPRGRVHRAFRCQLLPPVLPRDNSDRLSWIGPGVNCEVRRTIRQIADCRVRPGTKASRGCFSTAELTKGRAAPELRQDNPKSKKVVDKLIYPLLNGSFRTL